MIEVYYDDGSWRFRFISNEGREIYSPAPKVRHRF